MIPLGRYCDDCGGQVSDTAPSELQSLFEYDENGYVSLKDKEIVGVVRIPDDAKGVDFGGVEGCKQMTEVILPDCVTYIGVGAFLNCTALSDVIIPDGVTVIDEYAFSCCTGLTSITIPNSVTSIGWSALEGCTGLTSITFTGTTAQWKAIGKGNNWKKYTGSFTVRCTDGNIPYENA